MSVTNCPNCMQRRLWWQTDRCHRCGRGDELTRIWMVASGRTLDSVTGKLKW